MYKTLAAENKGVWMFYRRDTDQSLCARSAHKLPHSRGALFIFPIGNFCLFLFCKKKRKKKKQENKCWNRKLLRSGCWPSSESPETSSLWDNGPHVLIVDLCPRLDPLCPACWGVYSRCCWRMAHITSSRGEYNTNTSRCTFFLVGRQSPYLFGTWGR